MWRVFIEIKDLILFLQRENEDIGIKRKKENKKDMIVINWLGWNGMQEGCGNDSGKELRPIEIADKRETCSTTGYILYSINSCDVYLNCDNLRNEKIICVAREKREKHALIISVF